MYVFFDKNGDIKAITPVLDEGLSLVFSSANFPLTEVEGFLKAEKNTFDYQVRRTERIVGETFTLVKKQSLVNYTRTLDSYLTKIENAKRINNILTVTNDTIKKVIVVELAKEFKEMFVSGTEEDQELVSKFIGHGPTTMYLTKKDNPYHLLYTFSFLPRDLFETERLYFTYEGDYTNTSIYTKKIINGYGYRERVE
jgi:hypothetical protein